MNNALNSIDFYKSGHGKQYPDNTQMVYSTWIPRSLKHFKGSSVFDGKVVHFGLQVFIKDFLIKEFNETFFDQEKAVVVAQYKRRMDNALGKDAVPVDHIEALHELGYLPIEIKSLPEGSKVNPKVATITVKNTLPEFFWLVNYIESVMSADIWKPSTVATIANDYVRSGKKFADETSDVGEFALPFQFHDFSFRGMSGRKDAMISGMGHLLSSSGTDTVPAIDAAELWYNADSSKELIGSSVPATEHSVMCMGSKEGEIGTFKRLINDLYPSGIVSIVSDTWDFWQVVTEFLPELKQDILNRKENELGLAKVVIRPDSGDPVDIICGDESSPVDHVRKGAIECLWEIFGGEINSKGYKELNPRIGLIYGDSITIERAEKIMSKLKDKGFSSTNVVFGVGSYTYQMITRDTCGFAMKATAGVVDGTFKEIFKDPATDDGTKKSARGYVRVELEDGEYVMYDQQTPEQEQSGCLQTVFKDGNLIVDDTFQNIRERLTNN